MNSFYPILTVNVLILWRRMWISQGGRFCVKSCSTFAVQDQPQVYSFPVYLYLYNDAKYAHSVCLLMFELSSLLKGHKWKS